jgi:transcription elongation factor Elf1
MKCEVCNQNKSVTIYIKKNPYNALLVCKECYKGLSNKTLTFPKTVSKP